MRRRIVVLTMLVAAGSNSWAQVRTESRGTAVSDVDLRDQAALQSRPSPAQLRASALVTVRSAAIAQFVASSQAALPGLRITPNQHGLPKVFLRDGLPLTGTSSAEPEAIARNFLRQNSRVYPFAGSEVDRMRVTVRDVTPAATYLTLTQTIDGIDVFEGQIKFTLSRSGEVIQSSTGGVIPGASVVTRASLRPDEAEKLARDGVSGKRGTAEGRFIRASELVIFPLDAATGRLAYRLFLEADVARVYEILIDAIDGTLLYRHNTTVNAAAQGRVWKQSPLVGTRDLVDFPAAWLPDLATVTTGNNVDAWVDSNGDDRPDTTVVADILNGRASSPLRVFDFPFADGTTSANPRNSKAAAVTNLFYLVNTAHDYFYNLGFTEAAGNFQTDNFDKGGKGGDPVIAEAQQGLSDNNASFSPTPEGTQARMRIGIFTRNTAATTDDFDGDFDGQVVVHEYGHGVSNRLVGSLTSTSCLVDLQSGAMGEGWSDYFAMSFFDNPVMGAYSAGRPTRGVRRQSYEGYTFTYEDLGNAGYEVHNDGEIWAATLWDLRKTLGQKLTDSLVIGGLKSTPCNPSMTDARDAILSTDGAANSGANRAKIWEIFARHGLGFSASGVEGTAATGTVYDAAYDLPADLQPARGPAITSKPLSVTVGLGDAYGYTVGATNPAGGTLTFALANGPAGMSVDAGSGAVSWTGTFTSPRVKIEVTDGHGGRVVNGYLAPVRTKLTLGTPVVISGATDSTGAAYVDVPAGLSVIQFTTRRGSGDSDLYTIDPAGHIQYSGRQGSTETLLFASPAAGRWQVLVDAYEGYNDVILTAVSITPSPLSPNTVVTGLGGVIGSETLYRIPLPADTATFKVTTNGGDGDVDLYMKPGSPALCQASDNVSTLCIYTDLSGKDGNIETITLTSPAAGDWYLDVSGFRAYSGVTLTTSMTLRQPDLALTSSHSGNFKQGQKGGVFSIVVSNVGAVDSAGTVTVVDRLPAGLTATAVAGEGWTCVLATATCTRSDALVASGSYPAITLTVDVSGSAAASLINTATVSGGGESNTANDSVGDETLIGNGGPAAVILTGGIGPVYSGSSTIQAGSWVSIYGSNFASGVTEWNGDFPTTLGGVTVTINNKPAYLWFVSPGQINLQAPDDSTTGQVDVVVRTGNGTTTAKVNLAPAGPSFSMLGDGKHLAGVIATLDGTGAYGGGAYDLVGPTGGFPFNTRPVHEGETLLLYGVGFGPTVPLVSAGKLFGGAAPLESPVQITIGGVKARVLFGGITGAGLYQFNVVVPGGLGTGEKAVQAIVPGGLTPVGPLLSVQ